MDIKQKVETLTTAYIHSCNLALREVKNPNLAAQIATAVAMVINANMPEQQTIDPMRLLFAKMATAVREQAGEEEREVDDCDRAENETN